MAKYKFKKGAPKWREINSLKGVGNKTNQKENNRLHKLLKAAGWEHWDHCNILYEGYTISCRKTFPELQHGYLHLSWYWDNQGHNDFWRMTIYGFYNYCPGTHTMHPTGMYEISYITKDNLKHLAAMERRIVRALDTQAPLIPA